MSDLDFVDESGVTRLRGTLRPPPAGGIPQGGPLTEDLYLADKVLRGADSGTDRSGRLSISDVSPGIGGSAVLGAGDGANLHSGGAASLAGGFGGGGATAPGVVEAGGGHAATPGTAAVLTGGSWGAPGEALVSGGGDRLVYGGVRIAAAVPVAPPVGVLPLAFDSTPATGGLYVWNGAAWAKVSTIP